MHTTFECANKYPKNETERNTMKKLISLFLITALLATFSSLPVSAAELDSSPASTVVDSIPVTSTENDSEEVSESIDPIIEEEKIPSITMAINDETFIVNGEQLQSTAPILVLGKTYVDLHQLSQYLELSVEWVGDSNGHLKVSSPEGTLEFTVIAFWDDLVNFEHKFFIKDGKTFVSLRELTDFAGYDITYNKGLITVGGQNEIPVGLYESISTHDSNDCVYIPYARWALYVINPYQVYSYETMMNDIQKLQNMYPDIIRTSSIGKSVEGRDLPLIEFGRGQTKIFVCGTHHAREYIATTYLMYAIDRYAYAYRTNTMWGNYSPKEILDKITFCIVPMVNPDGVNLVQNGVNATQHAEELKKMKIYEGSKFGYSAWKANINGVDVNWNYNKDWDVNRSKNPRGSTGFNGDYPNSEPETVAVTNYVDNNTFEAYLSFHTQGQIFYWADNPDNPTNIQQAIKKDTGFTGYKESGTGVGGSFFDYVYRNFKKPTVTIELCPFIGKCPYPNNDFDTVWKPAKNILLVVGNEIIYKNNIN